MTKTKQPTVSSSAFFLSVLKSLLCMSSMAFVIFILMSFGDAYVQKLQFYMSFFFNPAVLTKAFITSQGLLVESVETYAICM